jgi:tetratricopeptide (TPR) repeat protein
MMTRTETKKTILQLARCGWTVPNEITRFRTIGLAFVLMLLFAKSSLAQADEEWLGKRVVPKYDNFALWSANRVVGPDGMHIYRVKEVNGPQVFLEIEGTGLGGGWALADQIIPVEHAMEFFTDYIRSRPRDPHGYLMRASIWEDEKELDIALDDLNEAVKLDRRKSYVYNNRGRIWLEKNEHDKAIADFNQAIRLDRTCVAAYHNRAVAWWENGDYDKALADLNEAARIDPSDVVVLSQRAVLLRETKKYDNALAECNRVIRIDPKNAFAYYTRALIWASCPDAKYRDGKKAIMSAAKACGFTEGKDPDDLACLAAAYAETGQFDVAVEWQTKANALYSDTEDKTEGESRLKLYQNKQPYRFPETPTNSKPRDASASNSKENTRKPVPATEKRPGRSIPGKSSEPSRKAKP